MDDQQILQQTELCFTYSSITGYFEVRLVGGDSGYSLWYKDDILFTKFEELPCPENLPPFHTLVRSFGYSALMSSLCCVGFGFITYQAIGGWQQEVIDFLLCGESIFDEEGQSHSKHHLYSLSEWQLESLVTSQVKLDKEFGKNSMPCIYLSKTQATLV